MRTIVLTVLMCVGAATTGSAQQTATPAAATHPTGSAVDGGSDSQSKTHNSNDSSRARATSGRADDSADSGTLAEGFLHEPSILNRGVDFAGRWLSDTTRPTKDGFYPQIGGLITGAGWISGGPGYRQSFWDGQALVDGSAQISWRAYKEAVARFELPRLANERLTVGSQVRWQDFTQINYYGVGRDSLDTNRSEYRLKDTDVLGYANVQVEPWLAVSGRVGWLRHPTLGPSAGPFDRNLPDTLVLFPEDPGVAQQPNFLHGDATVAVDTRDHPSRPTTGGFYRGTAALYSDRDVHQFSFRRYDVEGVQFVPLAGPAWVLAFHGWGVFSDTSAGNAVPFYLLPSLGGQNTLRGYHNYRFHDRNLLLASAESRWALFRHVDAAAFIDAGNVASRFRDLDLDKTSYGAGLRVHTGTSTLGRLDVAHSTEGWRVWFRLDDVFRLARRGQREEIVPFVP